MPDMRRMRPLLGTYVEVAACGPQAAAGLAAAFASLDASHARWSFQARDSELTRLNAEPCRWVTLSPATLRLLRLARAMARASGGRFDATVGGGLVLDGHLPDHGGPAPLRRGEAADIELGPHQARLRRPVRLTLDGIAKGYAVDVAVRALRHAGVGSGSVNAGGDLRVFGDRVMPVQRREADGRFTPLGGVRQAAMASSHAGRPSGDFAAWVIGAAGSAESRSHEVVTVMAATAWRADALTKVAVATPAHERAAAVARLGGHLVSVPVHEQRRAA
jgi:FAD:protein FMN transferase